MIYFDNAATTYPKPMAVTNAVRTALQKYGANPGRSGHKMSMAAAEEEYRCRVAAANLFHAEGPENVAFTLNCTHAINIVSVSYTHLDVYKRQVVPLEEEYLSTTGLVQLKSRETSSITRKFMSFVKEWQKPISEKAGTEKKEK